MPGAGDNLMELRRGRGCVVMNGIKCRLEHGIMAHERGKLRMALIARVL
jgi:hypothetical protein